MASWASDCTLFCLSSQFLLHIYALLPIRAPSEGLFFPSGHHSCPTALSFCHCMANCDQAQTCVSALSHSDAGSSEDVRLQGGNKFYKSSWGKENYRKEQTLDYINDLLINTSIRYPPYLISSITLCKFASKLWISAVLTFHRKK